MPVYDETLEGFKRKLIDESWLKENRDSVCGICLDGYGSKQEVVFLSCGHLNHEKCIMGKDMATPAQSAADRLL